VTKKRTWVAKNEDFKRDWLVVDAKNQVLGRLAAKIAMILMGKHKPTYTAHVDTGDYVVVVNADKFKVSGKKMKEKEYGWYTGYLSGWRTRSLEDQVVKHPTEPLMHAVRLMLPKNRLARKMLTKLKLYAGDAHPHAAQNPKPVTF